MTQLESSRMPAFWPVESDWTQLLQTAFESIEFQKLMRFIDSERDSTRIYPAPENVFNAFRFCPFQRTRVVVLGQDPYHGEHQADGLCFSVAAGNRLPPSLKNIFLELKNDTGIENQPNGDLTGWAEQGVMLLNTVLTVRRGQPHSHRRRGWEAFTDRVIRELGSRSEPIVFLLWGNPAAGKAGLIDSQHTVIKSPHPSPLAAYRGFFGSRPFSKTNATLQRSGSPPIDWQL